MQDRCDSLLQRLAALEAQSQRLDAFARAVAHDLKGPLCHISGYALYLRDVHRALPDANLRECLEMMHWQAKKTLALVDELLLWAGIDRETAVTSQEAHRQVSEPVLEGMMAARAATGVDQTSASGSVSEELQATDDGHDDAWSHRAQDQPSGSGTDRDRSTRRRNGGRRALEQGA